MNGYYPEGMDFDDGPFGSPYETPLFNEEQEELIEEDILAYEEFKTKALALKKSIKCLSNKINFRKACDFEYLEDVLDILFDSIPDAEFIESTAYREFN